MPRCARAAAEWFGRRFDVAITADQIGACVGTKEFVASLPHLLKLRNPARDTVLYPAVAYPTYEMGATLAGCRAVPVAVDTDWHLDLDSIAPADAERGARALGERTRQSHQLGRRPGALRRDRRVGARTRHHRRERRVLRRVRARARDDPRAPGSTNVLAVHSLSKRSNLAGMRCGFYAGDPDLVTYLVETRKHAGLMVPTPVQAAAAAALADDEHVAEQRHRYEERRKLVSDGLAAHGLVHDGGPCTFYLWLRAGARRRRRVGDRGAARARGHARVARRPLRRGGRRPRAARARATHGTTAARAGPPRCRGPGAARLTKGRPVDDATLKQVTQLWEAGDGWRDVLAPAGRARSRASR